MTNIDLQYNRNAARKGRIQYNKVRKKASQSDKAEKEIRKERMIDLQYADDITWVATNLESAALDRPVWRRAVMKGGADQMMMMSCPHLHKGGQL